MPPRPSKIPRCGYIFHVATSSRKSPPVNNKQPIVDKNVSTQGVKGKARGEDLGSMSSTSITTSSGNKGRTPTLVRLYITLAMYFYNLSI